MRTKILLTAVLSAACVATSVAQTVYSVNAVGYVNVTVPAGKFAILANPLDLPTNSIPAVLPDVPANTVVYVYNPATGGFLAATKRASGAWTGNGNNEELPPGKGFFIKNAGTTDLNITFVGEVKQGTNLVVSVPVGFSLLGSIVPQTGKLEADLKFPAAANDVAYTFDGLAYAGATRRASGAWTGSPEPTIAVGTGFFYKAVAAGSWARNFVIQP